jgi:hypothetical protein
VHVYRKARTSLESKRIKSVCVAFSIAHTNKRILSRPLFNKHMLKADYSSQSFTSYVLSIMLIINKKIWAYSEIHALACDK